MTASPPVVVIGAGVVGLAVAFELQGAGREVRVLERDRPGGGTTDVGAGMLAPVSEAETEEAEQIAFGLESLERYPDFVKAVEEAAGTECAFRDDGTLWVATNRDDRAQLEHLARTLAAKDLPFEWLDGARVEALEPHVSSRVLSGLRLSADAQVDPRRLARALTAAVESRGGIVESDAAVTEVVEEGGRVRGVRLGSRRLECDTVVLCAGAWSERELRLPLPPLGLRPLKGQLLRLRGPVLLRHVVRTPDVYLVPRRDGELLIGATMEEMDFDVTPTAGAAMDLLRFAWRALPGLYDLELTEFCVGLRSAVDDQLPVIGATPVEGLYLATGHYRNGVLMAPATAACLATLIASGEEPAELVPFRPARLWEA